MRTQSQVGRRKGVHLGGTGGGEDDQNRTYKMIRWGIEKSEDSLERGSK